MAGPYSQIRKRYKLSHGEADVCGLGLLDGKLVSSGDNDVKLWDLKTSECLQILKGHKAKVCTTGFHGPDLIYTGGSDRTLKIWSSTNGICLRTFVGHTRAVASALAQDGHLFSASHETILQWDIETGTLLRTINGHKGAINAITVSGKRIASGGNDRSVRIWDFNSSKGSCLTDVLQRHTAAVNTIVWTGKTVVSGSSDLTLCFWNTTMSTCSQQLEAAGNVRALGTIQQYLLAGIHIASVKLYDWEKSRYIKCFSSRKTNWIESLACDSTYLVTGDRKGLVRSYTFESTSRLSFFPARFPSSAPTTPSHKVSGKATPTKGASYSPSFSHKTDSSSPDSKMRRIQQGTPDSSPIVRPLTRSQTPSPGDSHRIIPGKKQEQQQQQIERKTRKASTASAPSSPREEPSTPEKIYQKLLPPAGRSLSPPPSFPHKYNNNPSPSKSGRRLSIGDSPTSKYSSASERDRADFSLDLEEDKLSDSKRRTSRDDLSSGRYVEQKNTLDHGNAVYTLAIFDQTLISGGTDGIIRIWDLETSHKMNEFQGHTNAVLALTYDKKILISSGRDNSVKSWDISKSSCLQKFNGHTNDVTAVLHRNSQLFTASSDQTVIQWDIEKATPLSTFLGHTDAVKSIDMDGSRIVSASLDRTIRIWDVRSKESTRLLKGHSGPINSVSFYNEGDGLVSGSSDMSIRLWDLKLDNCTTLQTGGNVRSIALQGKRLIAGIYMNTIKIFELGNGRCLKTISDQTNWLEVLSCHFNTLATGNRKGQIRVYNLEVDDDHKIMNKIKQKITSIKTHDSRYSELEYDDYEEMSPTLSKSMRPDIRLDLSLGQSKHEEISTIPEQDEELESPTNLVIIR